MLSCFNLIFNGLWYNFEHWPAKKPPTRTTGQTGLSGEIQFWGTWTSQSLEKTTLLESQEYFVYTRLYYSEHVKLSCFLFFFFFIRKTIVSLKAALFAYRIKKEKAFKQQLQLKLLVVRQPVPHSLDLTLNCSPLPFQGTSSHHQPSSSPRSVSTHTAGISSHFQSWKATKQPSILTVQQPPLHSGRGKGNFGRKRRILHCQKVNIHLVEEERSSLSAAFNLASFPNKVYLFKKKRKEHSHEKSVFQKTNKQTNKSLCRELCCQLPAILTHHCQWQH